MSIGDALREYGRSFDVKEAENGKVVECVTWLHDFDVGLLEIGAKVDVWHRDACS